MHIKNHGDDDAREMLRDLLAGRGLEGGKIYLPQFDESFNLVAGSPAESTARPEPRIDPTQLQRDWHNEYAAFILGLSNRLQETDTAKQRLDLLNRLAKVLEEPSEAIEK